MNRNAIRILISILLFCLVMALVERVIQPGYAVKSIIKLTLCLVMTGTLCGFRGILRREGLGTGLALGGLIYAVILAAFLLFRRFIDLDSIAAGMLYKEGISRENFLWVALYISVVNSLMEELTFRRIAFIQLRCYLPENWAMVFSALTFAGYHVAILTGWFNWFVYGLCLLGLFLGGVIFNFLDRKGSVLPSWLAHASANLAINTIGLIMYGLI